MPTVPTIEPTSFERGTTVSWTKDLRGIDPDWVPYLPNNFSFRYFFLKDGTHYEKLAIKDPDNQEQYLVSFTQGETAAYDDGVYEWKSYVNDASTRFLVGTGHWEILDDYKLLTSGLDHRSDAKKNLDALEAMISGKTSAAAGDVSSYQIAGRGLQTYSWTELTRMRDYYASLYKREQRLERAARGTDHSGLVKVRF